MNIKDKYLAVVSATLTQVLADSALRYYIREVFSFLYGYECRACDSSIAQSHAKLRFQKDENMKKITELADRKCVPAWNGLIYFRGNHYSAKTITDAQAVQLLAQGLPAEKFALLPAIPQVEQIPTQEAESQAEPICEALEPIVEATEPQEAKQKRKYTKKIKSDAAN